jgi:hypothetical protein
MVPEELCLVPGKTPPDASGSRPDSRYGKPSDVVARLSGQHAPRERCVNHRWARHQLPRGRWAEVLRHGFSRNRTFTARSPLTALRRFSPRPARRDALREEASSTTRPQVGGGLSTAGLGPTEPGGTGRPGSADLVKRRASRPALLPFVSRCDPRHQEAGRLSAAFRRCGCGDDQGEPVISSSPDFPPQGQGRSLSRHLQANHPELSRIVFMIAGRPHPDKFNWRRATRILCITKQALHIGSTGHPHNYPHALLAVPIIH